MIAKKREMLLCSGLRAKVGTRSLSHRTTGPEPKMPVNVAGGRRKPDASRTGTGTAGTAAVALRARVLQLRQALVLAMVPALPAPPALVVGLAGAAAAAA